MIELFEENPDAIILEDYDSAFIGIARRCGQLPVAAYSYRKIIERLCRDMSYDDAVDFFEFNIGGAWFGDNSPVFVEENEND